MQASFLFQMKGGIRLVQNQQVAKFKEKRGRHMNHVFLSGIVTASPEMLSKENEIPHVLMNLKVTHRNAAGVEKHEEYPISAWRGIAIRMKELVKLGSRISIKGYLSQRLTNEGSFIEVTAEEFHVSYQQSRMRPLRRTEANSVKEEKTQQDE